MNTNKEQTQHLTPEQQDALGSVVVQRDKMRQRLLKQRGHYRAMSQFTVALMMVAIAGPLLTSMLNADPIYFRISIVCAILCIWMVIQIHADCINGRIDALIELMKEDHAA